MRRSPDRPRRRTSANANHIVLWLSLVLVTFLVIEISSWATLALAKAFRPSSFGASLSVYQAYVDRIDDAYVGRFRSEAYDALLGWDNKAHTSRTRTNSAGSAWTATYDHQGARTNQLFSDAVLIATYGDSNTHGDEVDDHDTWQYYLSEKLGRSVQNFGVGGYGTDQALLKLERNLRNGLRAPCVILMVVQENIHRTLNTFRPFYVRSTGIKLGFKPRFILENGHLRLIPNPLQPFNDRADIARALRVASRNDYWFMRNRHKAAIGFPFSLAVLDLTFWVMHDRRIMKHPFKTSPSLDEHWSDPGPVRLMEAMIERFRQLSRELHFQPVLVFFPDFADVSAHLPTPSPYRSFVVKMQTQYASRDLLILDLSEAEFDASKFRVLPDDGHASPYGNKVISEFLHSRLCRAISESVIRLERPPSC